MICQDTYNWLLASRPDSPMPLSMRDHLANCPRCKAHKRRLRNLDRALRRLPPPAAHPQAVERLLQHLEQAPAPEPAPLPKSSRRQPLPVNWRLVGRVAAVLLLALGVGWLLLPPRTRDADEPSAEQMAAVGALRQQEPLVARVLGYDLRLAGTFKPAEQFQILADLAHDLGAEALRSAGADNGVNLAAVSVGYAQVVRRGLVGRSRVLPAESRAKLVATVVGQLRETAGSAAALARDAGPDAQEGLRTLKTAAESATALLRGERPPADDLPPLQIPQEPGSVRDLVGLLAAEGVRLAEESDPLRRADSCLDVSDQLLHTILQVSAATDAEEAKALGEHLGEVLVFGVVANLKRAEVPEGDARRLAEYRRISERGGKTAALLRQKLDQASPRARLSLEQAVDAARRGLNLASQAAREKPAPKSEGHQLRGAGQIQEGEQIEGQFPPSDNTSRSRSQK
jgi:hypothetical protein